MNSFMKHYDLAQDVYPLHKRPNYMINNNHV
jgi:hypothetical protein